MKMRIVEDISNFIFPEEKLYKADAILIPGCSYAELPERAANLFKSGLAPLIVPSGKCGYGIENFEGPKSKADIYNKPYKTESEFYADVLKANGVSPECIIQERKAKCTAQNAIFTKELLDEKCIHLKKAIICCKAYHARRCLMFYQFYFPNTEFMVSTVERFGNMNIGRDNWYKTDFGQAKVLGEVSRVGAQFKEEFERLLK